MSELNQRNALVAVASLTTVGIPATALAASSPDPIFAAIEARKKAEAWSYNEVGSRLDVDEETERDCANADADALRAMFSTVPATAAGAVALLRYVSECEADGDNILEIYMDEGDDRNEEHLGVHALFNSLIAAFTRLTA